MLIQNRLFRKFLLTYLIMLFIPLVFFLVFFRFEMFTIIRKQLDERLNSSLESTAFAVEMEFDQLVNIVRTIEGSNNFLLLQPSDPIKVIRATNTLSEINFINDFIKSIAFFSLTQERIYSDSSPHYPNVYFEEIFGKAFRQYISLAEYINNLEGESLVLIKGDDLPEDHLFFIKSIPVTRGIKRGTIVFEINIQLLKKILENELSSKGRESITLLYRNKVIYQVNTGLPITFIEDSDDFVDTFSLAEYNISQYKLKLTVIAEKKQIYMELTRSITNMILFIIILLLISLPLSYLFAMTNYNPIYRLRNFLQATFRNESFKGDPTVFAENQIINLIEEKQNLSNEINYSSDYVYRELLLKLMKGNIDNWNMFTKLCGKYKIDLKKPYYRVVCIASEKKVADKIIKTFEQNLRKIVRNEYSINGLREFNEYDVVLLIGGETFESYNFNNAMISYLEQLERRNLSRFSVAVSTIRSGGRDIAEGYLEAKSTQEHRFIVGMSQVLYADEIMKREQTEINYPKDNLEHLSNYMQKGDIVKASHSISTIFKDIQAQKISLFMARCISYDIIRTLIESISGLVKYEGEFWKYTDTMSLTEIKTIDQMEELLISLCVQLSGIVAKRTTQKVHSGMDPILEYIDKHKFDPAITAEGVADRFNLSLSNFSHQFKRQVGITFSNYLSEHRITEAKRLLKDSDENLTEIVICIGYIDPNSFIKKFKRKTGLTPMEYRRKQQFSILK